MDVDYIDTTKDVKMLISNDGLSWYSFETSTNSFTKVKEYSVAKHIQQTIKNDREFLYNNGFTLDAFNSIGNNWNQFIKSKYIYVMLLIPNNIKKTQNVQVTIDGIQSIDEVNTNIATIKKGLYVMNMKFIQGL
jgi:hypothetical protein